MTSTGSYQTGFSYQSSVQNDGYGTDQNVCYAYSRTGDGLVFPAASTVNTDASDPAQVIEGVTLTP